MEEKVNVIHRRGSVKPYIIGAAILLVVVVAVIVFLCIPKGISDSYFVSDDTKYVLTMEDNSFGAVKSHMVAKYKDNEITDLKTYYEFEDEQKAQTAFNDLKESESFDLEQFEQSGKYLIFKQPEDSYKEWSAADFKSLVDFYDNLDDESQESLPQSEPVKE